MGRVTPPRNSEEKQNHINGDTAAQTHRIYARYIRRSGTRSHRCMSVHQAVRQHQQLKINYGKGKHGDRTSDAKVFQFGI